MWPFQQLGHLLECFPRVTFWGEDVGENELLTTPEKKRSSSPFVDCPNTWKCRRGVYGTRNHSNDKRILNTRVLKVLSAVVEYKIDTF